MEKQEKKNFFRSRIFEKKILKREFFKNFYLKPQFFFRQAILNTKKLIYIEVWYASQWCLRAWINWVKIKSIYKFDTTMFVRLGRAPIDLQESFRKIFLWGSENMYYFVKISTANITNDTLFSFMNWQNMLVQFCQYLQCKFWQNWTSSWRKTMCHLWYLQC